MHPTLSLQGIARPQIAPTADKSGAGWCARTTDYSRSASDCTTLFLPAGDAHHWRMVETADVIVVGAGVQGASLAFHLARRGAASSSSSADRRRGRDRTLLGVRADALRPRERCAARLGVVPLFPAWADAWRRRLRLRPDGLPAGGARRRWRTTCAPTSRCCRRSASRRASSAGRGRAARPRDRDRRHRRRGLRAGVGLRGSVGHGGRVHGGRAQPRRATRPGLPGRRGPGRR